MIALIAVVSVAVLTGDSFITLLCKLPVCEKTTWLSGSNAYKMSPVSRLSTRLYLEDMNTRKTPPAPPGYK